MENVEKLLNQILESQLLMQESQRSMQQDIHELRDGQTRMTEDISGMKEDISGIKSDIEDLRQGQKSMREEMSDMKSDICSLKTETKTLNEKVDKNTLILEQLNKKLEIIAEVQTAHKEQDNRGFEKIAQEHGNTNTLITNSLKSVSDDVVVVKNDIKELKDKFDKVEKVTM